MSLSMEEIRALDARKTWKELEEIRALDARKTWKELEEAKAEIQRLKQELRDAYAELRKQKPVVVAVFDPEVWRKAKEAHP